MKARAWQENTISPIWETLQNFPLVETWSKIENVALFCLLNHCVGICKCRNPVTVRVRSQC